MMQAATQNKIAQKVLDAHAQKLESEFLTFEDTRSLFIDVFGNNIDEVNAVYQSNLRDAAFDQNGQTILLSEDLDRQE